MLSSYFFDENFSQNQAKDDDIVKVRLSLYKMKKVLPKGG
jgi:hypothetical protein